MAEAYNNALETVRSQFNFVFSKDSNMSFKEQQAWIDDVRHLLNTAQSHLVSLQENNQSTSS